MNKHVLSSIIYVCPTESKLDIWPQPEVHSHGVHVRVHVDQCAREIGR